MLIRPVWAEGNLKNMPLRTAPEVKDKPVAIEVHVEHVPSGNYEYSGLIWYFDDNNFVAIRKGPHGEDGTILSLVRRKAGKGDGPPSAPKNVVYNDPSVDLRMVVTGTKAQGWYRASSKDKWQSLGEVELPSSGAAKTGFAPATVMDPSRVGHGSASSASCNSATEDTGSRPVVPHARLLRELGRPPTLYRIKDKPTTTTVTLESITLRSLSSN